MFVCRLSTLVSCWTCLTRYWLVNFPFSFLLYILILMLYCWLYNKNFEGSASQFCKYSIKIALVYRNSTVPSFSIDLDIKAYVYQQVWWAMSRKGEDETRQKVIKWIGQCFLHTPYSCLTRSLGKNVRVRLSILLVLSNYGP